METIRTRKSFSLKPHDSTVFSSVKILPKSGVRATGKWEKGLKLTRIDYFLDGDGMALRLVDFGLEICDGLGGLDIDLGT